MALWMGLFYFGGIMTPKEEIERKIFLKRQVRQLLNEEAVERIEIINKEIEELENGLKGSSS